MSLLEQQPVSSSSNSHASSNSPAANNRAVANEYRGCFPTIASNRKRPMERNKQRQTTLSGQYTKKKPLAFKKVKKGAVVFKDLVLLLSPEVKGVPTHSSRVRLENDGFVIHSYPVDKNWKESELREAIVEAFSDIPLNCSFTFVKSCYGQLVVPKIAAGVEYCASGALNLAGQGAIYFKPEIDLQNDINEDEVFEAESQQAE